MLPTTLRKAAILISALDDRAADMLLEQMGPEQAARVRSAVMELDDISNDEQQRVLTEFLQRQGSPALANASHEPAGVELELETAEALNMGSGSPPPSVQPTDEPTEPATSDPPLTFLSSIAPEALAHVLSSEQPQIVAAVLAHLRPEHTAIVLQHLPSRLATEALERMATLEPLAPSVLADLERELKARVTRHFGPSALPEDAVRRLNAVLGAMDYRQRERLVLQLTERNALLASRLGLSPAPNNSGASDAYRATSFRYRIERPDLNNQSTPRPQSSAPILQFGDLSALDDQSLRAVFAAAEPAVVLLALIDADQRLLDRVFSQVSPSDADILRRRLDHPGPVHLREIEQAQRTLAALASQLAVEGTIRLPQASRFAAAA